MRRLSLKNEEKKSKRSKQLAVGGVLIALMLMSVLGYSFSGSGSGSENSKVVYNGVEFINQDGYWFTQRGDVKLVFSHSPEEIILLESEVNPSNDYYGNPLYVYSVNTGAEIEVFRNFDPSVNQIALRMQRACPSEEECGEASLPVKECDENFIVIRESNQTSVVQNDSCVLISAPEEDLTKVVDGFLLKVFGIA